MRIGRLLQTIRADLRLDTTRGKLVRSAGWTAAIKIGATAIAFLASLLYARVLGPHGYGLYAYVTAWALVLAIPAGLGLPQYLVREAARHPGSLGWLLRWGDRKVVASGLVAALLMSSAYFLPAAAQAGRLMVVAAPIPLLASLAAIRGALLQARGQVVQSQWPSLAGPAVMLAILAVAWLASGGLRPIDLVVLTTTTAFGQFLVNHVQTRRLLASAESGEPATVRLGEALPFVWMSGLYLLNSRTDVIMLGSLKGAYEVGIYAIAARAAELTSLLMGAVNVVLAPKIAQLHHAGDHASVRRLVRGASRRVLFVTLPLALFLIVGAKPLLAYFYGEQYASGALVLQVLVAAQLVVVGSGPLGTLLNMTGHVRTNSSNMAIAVGLNILLNALLIPRYGAHGAAAATAASLVFSRLLLSWQARRLGLHFFRGSNSAMTKKAAP